MTKLEEIRKSLDGDMARLNDIIKMSLNSDSPLMNSVVAAHLATKGKQLRPLLVLLSGKLFGGVNETVLNAGAAIELLHNASLIHDDVIDQAKVRRGQPTVSSVYDNHVAVLTGDFFITSALRCAVRTGDPRILDELAIMGGTLSLGEIDQISNAQGRNITEEVYMSIIGKKTAKLFESCVAVGGYARQQDEEAIKPLRRYAQLLGLCFQMKDDTFDYYHDPAVGKPTGNDLREGKITLPLIYALSLTSHPRHEEMKQLVHKQELSASDIETLVEFAKEAGGIDYTYDRMAQLRDEACALLDCYEPSDTIEGFKQLFQYIIVRKV